MTRKGWLLFIAISVFWGIPYFFIKIVVRELDPAVVVFARAATFSSKSFSAAVAALREETEIPPMVVLPPEAPD